MVLGLEWSGEWGLGNGVCPNVRFCDARPAQAPRPAAVNVPVPIVVPMELADAVYVVPMELAQAPALAPLPPPLAVALPNIPLPHQKPPPRKNTASSNLAAAVAAAAAGCPGIPVPASWDIAFVFEPTGEVYERRDMSAPSIGTPGSANALYVYMYVHAQYARVNFLSPRVCVHTLVYFPRFV